jgi:AcrR family transcriptional regulator
MTDAVPRDAILGTAHEVLVTTGYRRFTIELVAARAGVDRAVIDRWWTGDSDLLIDVLAEAMTIKKIPKTGNSRVELSTALHHMIHHYTDWQQVEPVLLAFAADHAADPAVLEQLRQRCIRRSRDRIGAVLRRAANRGDLPPDVDTDLVQDVWAGAIAYRRLVSGGSLNGLVSQLLDMLLSGMAPVRPPDPNEPPDYEPPPWWLQESTEWLNQHTFGQLQPLRDGVPVRALGAIRPTVTIAGRTVTITTYVGRDFMPGMEGPHSSALMVLVTVSTPGPGILPPFLHADRIAVLHDDEVWVAPLTEYDLASRTSRRFQVAAPPGPEWETGTKVDIVVQLRTEHGEPRLVRAANKSIARTE